MVHTPALKTWSKLIYAQLKSIIWPINWINTILKSFSYVASDLENITSPAAFAFSGRKQVYTQHLYFCATWQFSWKITTGSHRTKSPFVDTSTVPLISSQPFYNAVLAVLKNFLSDVTTYFPKLLKCKRQHSVFQHQLHSQAESKKRAGLSLESYTENLPTYFSIQSSKQEVFFLSCCCEIQNHARSHFSSAWTIPSLFSHTHQSTHILPGCCMQTKGVFLTDAWLQFVLNLKR